ncbi:CYTH and CHAD domain-containing protein [Derxia gummosa]|uniref:CYTH and CHAD domain-containing protein n=1 Tax=Derxia gummosa DSM 723 TaxID=1121388 RepID=A0A8B6X1U4_9BURK|nr:CYTH and CHAD domain-containing protein [Derxia gummosa]
MANEIELKLAIAPADLARLRGHPLVERHAEGEWAAQTLANRYFDTPGRDLARSRAALRLRLAGEQWWQTLKTSPASVSGLSARGEWEVPVAGAALDFDAFTDLPDEVRALLDRLAPRLGPVFDTDFERESRTLRLKGGTRFELALDRGELRAGKGKTLRREPICEVELELIEGDPRRVLDFAERLAADIALIPETRSKAARGFALADRRPAVAAKVALPEADPAAHAGALLAAVVTRCQQALLLDTALIRAGATTPAAGRIAPTGDGTKPPASEGGSAAPSASVTDDAEDPAELVHQARVALRRLRVALRHARPLLPRREAELRAPLRELGRRLGRTRDLDVLTGQTLPRLDGKIGAPSTAARDDAYSDADLRAALDARLAADRAQALDELREALASPAFARTMLQLEGLALRLAAKRGAAADRLARRELKAARDAARSTVAALDGDDAEARHQFRIAVKRYRYALDMYGALFDADAVQAQRKALSHLQDVLGEMNDDAVAIARLDLLPSSPHAADLARAARDAIAAAQPEAARLARELLALPAPWKKPAARS